MTVLFSLMRRAYYPDPKLLRDYAVVVNESPGDPLVVEALPFSIDAASVAKHLRMTQAWCWLDGEFVSADETRSAWSYLGIASTVRSAERGSELEFLAALREPRPSSTDTPSSLATHDGGFFAGWVVALGYEFGVALLGAIPADDDVPSAFALKIDVVLAVHEATGRAELRGGRTAIKAWRAQYGWILSQAVRGIPSDAHGARNRDEPSTRSHLSGAHRHPHRPRDENEVVWLRSETDYLNEVEACRAAIRAGDAYVLCLTDTAAVHGRFDPLDIYTRLRDGGGAIRGGLIVAGARALVTASPERFLSVRHDESGASHIATHPIKGTRPRGATRELDAKHSAELAGDPKELAENLMIVDLMRNDLSRVCQPGSVRTEGFQRVEAHAHVLQLVSTVSGVLRPDIDVYDAIESCFPGGSMTGAPKRRAVEILGAIERAPRGLYAGCFGWIDHNGSAELAMTIRGAEIRAHAALNTDGRFPEAVVLIGAGGGITIDSDPVREMAEVRLKAQAVLAAL